MKQYSQQEAHQYWKNPSEENKPERYVDLSEGNTLLNTIMGKRNYGNDKKRSEYLVKLISKYVDTTSSILELGCNGGRNLHFLYSSGFENLSGVEINENALETFNYTYPELYNRCKLYNYIIRLLKIS